MEDTDFEGARAAAIAQFAMLAERVATLDDAAWLPTRLDGCGWSNSSRTSHGTGMPCGPASHRMPAQYREQLPADAAATALTEHLTGRAPRGDLDPRLLAVPPVLR